jgi:NADH-quinone oxidoreductase subunit F
MDLRFLDATPTPAERVAVDAVLGEPEGAVAGDPVRSPEELRVARGGAAARAQRHLLLPALNEVQSRIGWISRGALDYVCKRLTVPPAEAYGVASFYALLALEERPPRVAHVCDDIGCRGFGAASLTADLADRLGAPGEVAGGTTWMPSPCLGQCDRAPAVYLQLAGDDDDVVSSADADAVLARLAGAVRDPVVPGVPQAGDPGLRLLRRIGSEPGLDAYKDAGGYEALPRAMELGPAGVLDELEASGLRGRGGAAFPAAVKWRAVAGAADAERYLICNADESEPGTFKDRVLLEGDPFAVVEAMTIAGITVGAERGYVYVRGEYPGPERRMRAALAAARDAGLLGERILGSPLSFDVEIRRGAGAYICGEETALMNSIEGYRGEPRNKPPFPTEHGLFGKPTVINNVETLVNVLDIVTDGGRAYAAIGTPASTGTRLFCLSGAVARPGVYEVPLGTPLGSLVALAGGGRDGADPTAVLLGGAAGSFVGPDALDMPLTFEDAHARGLSLGSGVVMLFDGAADFGDTVRRIAAFFRDESCGQCVPCRVGTVRQEELLARHAAGQPLDASLLAEIERVMADASICGLGHTAAIAIRSAVELGLLAAT